MSIYGRNMKKVFLPNEDREIDVDDYLNALSEAEFFIYRRELEETRKTNPQALCAVCFQPVVLRANGQRTKFFAHPKNSEDCPIKVTSAFTKEEILKMQYNGQKEGRRHRENKLLLAELLRSDELFCDDVEVEPTFREANPTGVAKHWRRPDISSTFKVGNKRVVFELQVNTTFLSVIIERENFYKENDTYISWVSLAFDPKKFTTLDISYANRANMFVFDDVAKEKSKEERKLYLTCYYMDPHKSKSLTVEYSWSSVLVDFSELTFDEETKKIYGVDTRGLLRDVKESIESDKKVLAEKKQRELEERKRIRDEANERKRVIEDKDKERQRKLNQDFLAQRYQRTANSSESFFDKASSKGNPNMYANRRGQALSATTRQPESNKSYGATMLCKYCGNRDKPKMIGRELVCKKCVQPLD